MAVGGARIGAGRKSKADEERLRDKLSPWVSTAIETVVHVMQNAAKESDRLAAAKLIIEYLYGKPKQTVDTNIIGINPTITVVSQQDANALKSIFDGANLPNDQGITGR